MASMGNRYLRKVLSYFPESSLVLHVKCNNKLHKCNLGRSLPLKVIPDLFRSLISVLRKIKAVFEHCRVHGCHEGGHKVSRPPVGDIKFNLIFYCCFLTKGH